MTNHSIMIKRCFSFLLSNPLTYAVCLEELGQDVVQKFQGRAPSGRTFNEIVLDHQGINLIFFLVISNNMNKNNKLYIWNTKYNFFQKCNR